MAFGRQMHDGVGLVKREDAVQLGPVTDVHVFEHRPFAVHDAAERIGMGCVGQFVQTDDRCAGVVEHVPADCRSDETGGTGDDDLHRSISIDREQEAE
jgi:hypothetical protein